jgi:hypothetical protein
VTARDLSIHERVFLDGIQPSRPPHVEQRILLLYFGNERE